MVLVFSAVGGEGQKKLPMLLSETTAGASSVLCRGFIVSLQKPI